MDNKLYVTVCIVTKTANSTWNVIPTQGTYARLTGWSEAVPVVGAAPGAGLLRRLATKFGL